MYIFYNKKSLFMLTFTEINYIIYTDKERGKT